MTVFTDGGAAIVIGENEDDFHLKNKFNNPLLMFGDGKIELKLATLLMENKTRFNQQIFCLFSEALMVLSEMLANKSSNFPKKIHSEGRHETKDADMIAFQSRDCLNNYQFYDVIVENISFTMEKTMSCLM
jgi:hypothetical protein